jgi:hypothetical protein
MVATIFGIYFVSVKKLVARSKGGRRILAKATVKSGDFTQQNDSKAQARDFSR